jgi:hypothetical protein
LDRQKHLRQNNLTFTQGGNRVSIILSLVVFSACCQLALAGESDSSRTRKFFNSSSVTLGLQTNSLGLVPKGTAQIYTAFEFRPDWQAPITRVRGDLCRFGVLRFDFGIAQNVSLQIRGALRQILRFDKGTNASDVGDFSVATIARILPAGTHRPALGFRLETKLPNTNQDRGIGTNTTDVTMSILATKPYGTVVVFAEAGIGILTSPRQLNDQNDVLVYGLGALWNLSQHFQLAGEINGFFSSRHQIPLGTEDRSAARLGVSWKLSKFALEILAVNGLVEREGNLGVMTGLSWQINL